jgi:hypothetical protein
MHDVYTTNSYIGLVLELNMSLMLFRAFLIRVVFFFVSETNMTTYFLF